MKEDENMNSLGMPLKHIAPVGNLSGFCLLLRNIKIVSTITKCKYKKPKTKWLKPPFSALHGIDAFSSQCNYMKKQDFN